MKMVNVLNLGRTGVAVGKMPSETPNKFAEGRFVLVGGQISQIPEMMYEDSFKDKENIVLLSERDAKALLKEAKELYSNPAGAYVIRKMNKEREEAEKENAKAEEKVTKTKEKGGKKE